MDYIYHKLKAQLAVLKDISKEYPTNSLQNIILQTDSRIKEIEKAR